MKKMKQSVLVVLMLTLMCCTLAFASCDDSAPTEPIKLVAPQVILDGDVATWQEDSLAEKFEISLDGSLSYIENSVTSKKLLEGQTFKIRAIGDGVNYANSDWSKPVTFAKADSGYTITWKNGETILEIDEGVPYGTTPFYNGATPTKAATEQYTYTFVGWNPRVNPVTESVTYEAQFEEKIRSYTVTFYMDDGVTKLAKVTVNYGAEATYTKSTPVKNATPGQTYVFDKWVTVQGGQMEADLTSVTSDMNVYASFAEVVRKVNVFVVSNNTDYGTVSASVISDVPYGAKITTSGNAVLVNGQLITAQVATSTTQYTYSFVGWTADATVGNDTIITANFSCAINSYTVTWVNGDQVLEIDQNVDYGTTPVYNGAVPTQAATSQYTYTFSGWTPQISSVTGSVTYQAQFTETLRTYTVTFYSEDGLSVLDTVTVEYGANAIYSKSTPVKNATAGHTYVFEKWVTTRGGSVADDLANVIDNRSVYASFKDYVRTVTVYIVSNNTDYGTVSVSTLNNVPYGATITVNGNTVTINGQTVTANANTATAQYAYTFANWTADATVGNDTIITATFSRSVNSYTVTWKNGDDTLETDENVAYGTTPVYNGALPTKESDNENIYTFNGWSPAISSVTGDITYVAQFTTTANKHTVVFYDDDGVTELGRVVVGHGETAIYPNALPTKKSTAEITYTFEKWVTAKDGATEASFTNITEDKAVYAKYYTTARTYVVTFCDYDGTTISQINVAYGNVATAPGDPEREGYRFDGWDKTFSNITGELTVKATYVQQFTVEFLDYDNSVIDIQLVDYNGNATAPENPSRNNYRFTGWNTSFSNVVHNLTVKAEYIRQYKVTFLDYDETVLKEVTVDAGSTAVAPSNPSKEGYTFDGWDKAFTNVSSDLTVTATYKVKTYTVKFVMPDGTVIGEVQSVEHGFSAIAPEYPEFYLEGTGDYTKVYAFTRWNKSFNSVTEDLIIEAVYESDYTKPVIIIEYSQERNGDVKLYIYNHESIKLNAIEFTINYSTRVGNISINSATVNSASPLWVEDSDGNNNNQYVINNNENIFTFAWSDANGKQFDWCSKVITFNFSTDGAVVGEATFRIDGCSAIVSDSNGENLEKITPVIVYR